MIPFLSPFLFRLLGPRFKWLADILAIAAIIAAVWGAAALWLHFHDRKVIADHEEAIKTEIIEVQSEASAIADAAIKQAEAEFAAEQAKLEKEIEDAKKTGSSPFDGVADVVDCRELRKKRATGEGSGGKADLRRDAGKADDPCGISNRLDSGHKR